MLGSWSACWRIRWSVVGTMLGLLPLAYADGPQDNRLDQARPVPPPGVEVPAAAANVLRQELGQLQSALERLGKNPTPRVRELLPDVQIFARGVEQALTHGEFFTPEEIQGARDLLREGLERAEQLARGEAPWTTRTGLVVRGYVSRLDQTVQPYGLVIPANYRGAPTRLDVWLHGRGEKLSEVAFLLQRRKQVGSIAPANTIVLHPYGRYCNAFKFAGEIDVLEAMAAVKRHYQIDGERVAIRGFSMGGAGCWQLAVHYPDLWFAANPGAGFSETPEFLRDFQQETLTPTDWERTLWQWYDCPVYAVNLENCPTVAYSGELDIQRQAAVIMEKALEKEQLLLTHIIGPETKHSIHPGSAVEIEARLSSLAVAGRERTPRRLRFATPTLKYNRSHWLTVDGLERHWTPARVEAELPGGNRIRVRTQNVTGFTLDFAAGTAPFDPREPVIIQLNDRELRGPRPGSDRSWRAHCWQGLLQEQAGPPSNTLAKRHNLQGPIDDAFLEPFIIVRPTGTSPRTEVDAWARREMDRLIREWRRHFRGDAIVKDDTAITAADMAQSHLILFGDEASNSVIRQVSSKLPVRWDDQGVAVAGQTFAGSHHVPVLVYPNPLSGHSRYVVLNSGFTYREYDYLNNARQVPRLPDWAVVDIRTPPDPRYPGKIVAAGFWNERWE